MDIGNVSFIPEPGVTRAEQLQDYISSQQQKYGVSLQTPGGIINIPYTGSLFPSSESPLTQGGKKTFPLIPLLAIGGILLL